MKITHIDSEPLLSVPYLNAGRRPNDFFEDQLPVYHATVNELPKSVDAILVTADLQGLEPLAPDPAFPPRLLGEALPDILDPVFEGLGIDVPHKITAFLAGDFYTYPDLRGRGGTGDVTNVWKTFADRYGLVYGVGGNHDLFGSDVNSKPNWRGPEVFFLDGDRAEFGSVRVAGLSGVIGNPRKNFRRTHQDYIESLELLLSEPTDILITHDGPDVPNTPCRGIPEVREVILKYKPSLVVRGHSHWPQPCVQLSEEVQVLNVDATVVILTRE